MRMQIIIFSNVKYFSVEMYVRQHTKKAYQHILRALIKSTFLPITFSISQFMENSIVDRRIFVCPHIRFKKTRDFEWSRGGFQHTWTVNSEQ